MDVTHLVPTPIQPNSPSSAATRARNDRAAFEAAPVPVATAPEAPLTPRPVATTGAVGDRIERSPELERTVVELKLDLSRLPDAPPDRLEQLRSDLASGGSPSSADLARAAENLLTGDVAPIE